MKRAISVILGLCLICQCMVQLGIVGWYQANKEYIAANLCINRDKPELNCCGKCYLKKQLSKSEQNSGTKSNPTKSENLTVFILPHIWLAGTSAHAPQRKYYTAYNSAVLACFPRDIFHPPPHRPA